MLARAARLVTRVRHCAVCQDRISTSCGKFITFSSLLLLLLKWQRCRVSSDGSPVPSPYNPQKSPNDFSKPNSTQIPQQTASATNANARVAFVSTTNCPAQAFPTKASDDSYKSPKIDRLRLEEHGFHELLRTNRASHANNQWPHIGEGRRLKYSGGVTFALCDDQFCYKPNPLTIVGTRKA